MFWTFKWSHPAVCVQCTIWLLSVIPRFRVSALCCSGFFWVIYRWFKSFLLLSISICFRILYAIISIGRSLYFKIFLASFLITFLSAGNATSIDIRVPCLLSQMMISSLLFYYYNNSVGLHCFIHNNVTSRLWPVCKNFGTWPYRCLLYNSPPIPLHMLQCSSAHTVSCLCMYCSLANIVHADMMHSTVSSSCLHSAFILCL